MGLDKIIADRVGNKGVGFNSEIAGPTSTDENDLLRQVLPQDLNAFGMIPEFIGRTPVITRTQALDEDDLVRILTEPRNAIAKQYRRMFQLEGAELEFEARGAARDRQAGARPQDRRTRSALHLRGRASANDVRLAERGGRR